MARLGRALRFLVGERRLVNEDVGTGRITTSEDLLSAGVSIDFGAARRAFFPPPEPPEELPPE